MKNKRGLFIALILLLGVALTIGYAVLSQTLTIKGRTNIASNSWIIYFDHLVERPGTLTPTTPTTINAAKDRIDFTISLEKPGDNYTFEVDIINDGSIDAMIDTVSLTGIPEDLDGIIEWKVNYLTGEELRKCDELLANTKRRIKVVVNYNKDIDELPDEQVLNLQLSVKYVQLDNSVCTTTNPPTGPDPIDPNDGRHTLTVDPNYGIYNGSDETITLRMAKGEVYIFGDDPVQEAHTFTGWNIAPDETYSGTTKMITMDEEDVDAVAGWTWDVIGEPEEGEGYCFSVRENPYRTFAEALNSISEEGTIKLLHNGCSINVYTAIPEDTKVTYDLNGHIGLLENLIESSGEFIVTDSSKAKKGELHTHKLENSGVSIHALTGTPVSVIGGKYYVDTPGFFLQAYNDGSLTVENAEFYIEQTDWAETIYLSPGTTSTIQNNKFYTTATKTVSTSAVLYAQSNVNLELKDNYFEVESKSWGYRVLYFNSGGSLNLENNIIKGKGVLHGILNNGTIDVDGLTIDIEVEVDENTSTSISSSSIQAIGSAGTGSFKNTHIIIKGNPTGKEVYGIMNTCTLLKDSSIDIDVANGKVYGILAGSSNIEDSTVNIKTDSGSSTTGIYASGTITNVDVKVENSHVTTYGINGNVIINNANIEIKMNGEGGDSVSGATGAAEVNDSTISIEYDSHNSIKGLDMKTDGTVTNSTITITGPDYGRTTGVYPASTIGEGVTYNFIQTN